MGIGFQLLIGLEFLCTVMKELMKVNLVPTKILQMINGKGDY